MTDLRFDGRAAVVTGAGRGLGRAYAAALASRGATVIVNDIDAEDAVNAASSIPGAIACAADVATAGGARDVVQRALDACGRVDIVIANAGTSWHRAFADLTADELHDVLGPNLFGTFHVVHAAWPHLLAQGAGRIVTTASGAVFGFVGRSHYAAAKGAVLALTATLALEGAPHGVFANCVLPWARTRMARAESEPPDPSLAAPAVVWLCHESCTENGAAFVIGGGRIARVDFGPGPGARVGTHTPEAYRDLLA